MSSHCPAAEHRRAGLLRLTNCLSQLLQRESFREPGPVEERREVRRTRGQGALSSASFSGSRLENSTLGEQKK
jgi:hypothetical protein